MKCATRQEKENIKSMAQNTVILLKLIQCLEQYHLSMNIALENLIFI